MFVSDSQAVMVDQKMYLSGCIGLDPTTANLVSGGIEPETNQVCILCFTQVIGWMALCDAS